MVLKDGLLFVKHFLEALLLISLAMGQTLPGSFAISPLLDQRRLQIVHTVVSRQRKQKILHFTLIQ